MECKAIKRDTTLDDEEVDRWLDVRLPRLINYCNSHPDYKDLKKSFELWVSGEISEKSTLRINEYKKRSSKIKIKLKKPPELLNEVKETGDKSLKNLLFSYFLKKSKQKES